MEVNYVVKYDRLKRKDLFWLSIPFNLVFPGSGYFLNGCPEEGLPYCCIFGMILLMRAFVIVWSLVLREHFLVINLVFQVFLLTFLHAMISLVTAVNCLLYILRKSKTKLSITNSKNQGNQKVEEYGGTQIVEQEPEEQTTEVDQDDFSKSEIYAKVQGSTS